MQGARKTSTPEATPKALAASTVLAMPASGSSARPASGLRRATAGTARKNGVESKREERRPGVPDQPGDVERVERLVERHEQRHGVSGRDQRIGVRRIGADRPHDGAEAHGSAARQGPERADPRLVGAERVPAGSQHMRLERRDAGDVHEQPVHEGRPRERQPAPRIAAGEVDGDQRVGDPAEPFEEVVRVARPSPEPGVADLAPVGRRRRGTGRVAGRRRLRRRSRRRRRRCRAGRRAGATARDCARRSGW